MRLSYISSPVCVAVYDSVLQSRVRCSVLQCMTVCCSVLQCVYHVPLETFAFFFRQVYLRMSTFRFIGLAGWPHCNTIQQTAKHCNTRRTDRVATLQHTATHTGLTGWPHCNRLQRTATDCNGLQQTVTQRGLTGWPQLLHEYLPWTL